MSKFLNTVTACVAIIAGGNASASDVPERYVTVKHNGFTLVMDCVTKTPLMFNFQIGKDVWNEPRSDSFDTDPVLPSRCQQERSSSYGHKKGTMYHRGHLVGANAMDNSRVTMEESFYMSNIIPQAEGFNRGAWLKTEQYQECLRERSEIVVLGGVAFNDDQNDFFIKSHGIKTPDIFWKIIITGEGYYAWKFDNTNEMTGEVTNQYLTTVNDIEQTIGFGLNLGPTRQLLAKTLPLNIMDCPLG